MRDLIIQSTPSTPEIEFRDSGQLSIKGKSLPEDPQKFYGALFSWLEEFDADEVQLDVKLEYVNTSSSKNILNFIQTVDRNNRIKHLKLNWHYEADDLDMLEFGEIILRSLKRTKATYIEYFDDF